MKDALISALAGYTVTTFPIWEVKESIWLVGFMAAVLFWDLLIRIEEFQKKKGANGTEIPKARRKKPI